MSTWLSLGCSPTAPEGLERARADFDIDTTITTNAGIELIPQPDYLLSFDTISAHKYAEKWNLARARGTMLVTFVDWVHGMTTMGVSGFDVTIRRSHKDVIEFKQQEIPTKGHSGMIATHFAAMRATRVILVGQDGYAPGRPDHWYDSHTPNWTDEKREENLRKIVQPFYRRLAVVFPGVEFIQYGRPNFDVGEPNWRVVEIPNDSDRSAPG